jgi:hypothetical protein
MRALCEGCGKHQPPGWKAGDLCSFCGKAVRHDVRCYWCAKWVPAAKFCRSCGAAVVEERLYGAARMLKDAGTDRFSIPKQLQDFDPDEVENFSRIYQRHAIAVARHVDEVRFLERFLHQKAWSGALEEQLIPQLPWNEETLARMSAPPLRPGDDLATVKAIQETSPFGITQSLATLARLRLRDGEAYPEAGSLIHSGDAALRAEAALALTHWRVWSTFGRLRDLEPPIVEELRKSPFKVEAAVRLGLLGQRNADLLRDGLASSDPDVAFTAALVLGDVERLQAALQGDDLQRIVAGNKLIALGIIKPVVQTVEKSPLEVQRELVEALIQRKEPAPEAEETLLGIVETTKDEPLRERAARILCRQLRPEWVLRIARAAGKDRHIFQSLLQAPNLDSDGAVALGDVLIQIGFFRMSQYGLSSIAENGRMPETFVPTRFDRADEETRQDLLRFAEMQLHRQQGEPLHKFVMGVVFGPYPSKIRSGAWWVLHRSYRHLGEHRGEGPFRLEKGVLQRFFGSVRAFLPKLAAVLRDRDTMKEVGYYEMMANLLGSADDAGIAAIQAEKSGTDDLMGALLEAMRGDYWPSTIEAMITLVSRIGSHPRWRDRALAALHALGRKGNYCYDKALRRLELSVHGIPEEVDWHKLPLDFVPSRFAGASPEGRREFLKLVEQQLIHKRTDEPDRELFRLLLETALAPGDRALRTQAMGIYKDRARPDTFPLRKTDVKRSFGPFSEFLPLLTAALEDHAATLEDPARVDFLEALFRDAGPGDAAAIAAEGPSGLDLMRALVAVAGARSEDPRQSKLRRQILRYLTEIGGHEAWRDELANRLDALRGKAGYDLVADCERALQGLRPPVPRPDTPSRAPRKGPAKKAAKEPPPAEENPYAAKQRIAEQMGKDLQTAIATLMAGPKTPEEKMREATRMSEEFQANIKKLYGA